MRRGATFIELALMMLVVSFALVFLATMYQAMSRANASASLQMKALVLGQSLMEKYVRAVPYAQLAPVSGVESVSGLSYSLSFTEMATGLKRADLTITGPDATPMLRLATLTAQVPPP